jgi:hypothetical protein
MNSYYKFRICNIDKNTKNNSLNPLDYGYFLKLNIDEESHWNKLKELFQFNDDEAISERGYTFNNRVYNIGGHRKKIKRFNHHIYNFPNKKKDLDVETIDIPLSMLPSTYEKIGLFIEDIKKSLNLYIPQYLNKLKKNNYTKIIFNDLNNYDNLKRLISDLIIIEYKKYDKMGYPFRRDSYIYNNYKIFNSLNIIINEYSRLLKKELFSDQHKYTKIIGFKDKNKKREYFLEFTKNFTEDYFKRKKFHTKNDLDIELDEEFKYITNPDDYFSNLKNYMISKFTKFEYNIENIYKKSKFYKEINPKPNKNDTVILLFNKDQQINSILMKKQQIKNLNKIKTDDIEYNKETKQLQIKKENIGKFHLIHEKSDSYLPTILLFLKIN